MPDRRCCPWSLSLVLSLTLFGVLSGIAPRPAPAALQSVASDTSDLSDARARKLFVQGMTQSYLADYGEAVSLFENALDRAPHTPAILSALSEAEAGRDNLTSAIYYARQARTHAPDTVHYHLQLARHLKEAGQKEEAVSTYQTLVSKFPSHPDGRLELARLLKEQGQTDAALRHYERLLTISKEVSAKVYHNMIELYRTTDDTAGLERTLQKLVRHRSDRPLYRRLLGHVYTQQGRYREALSLLEPLLQETPNDPRLLSQLKMLYNKTDQTEKMQTLGGRSNVDPSSPDHLVARSRSLYQRSSPLSDSSARSIRRLLQDALDQSPKHVGALHLLGKVHADAGQPAAAGAAFKRALDADPRAPARWRRAASAYLDADSFQTAAALAEEGSLLFPGRYDLVRLEAEARLHMGRHAVARDHFETALSRIDTTTISVSERAGVRAGLGRALDCLGQHVQADSTFREALRLDPTHPEVLLKYARHLADRDTQLDRALQLAQRAVDHGEASPAALGTLGWVHARRGATDRAVSTFERALEAGPPDAWVYERFGDLHRRLGNERAARRYWKKAVDHPTARSGVHDKLQSIPQS